MSKKTKKSKNTPKNNSKKANSTQKLTQKHSPKYSVVQRLAGFVELGRPIEWSKPLLNMTLAMLIAFYVYQAGVSFEIFVAGFASVALLWSGLYALNDYTDWKIDLIHAVKKNRPIPSGKVSPVQGIIFSIGLIIISFWIAFAINNFLLAICLLAMFFNQWLYTMKPFRLKSRKGFDMISGSMVNPLFRYFSGLVLFVPSAALFTQITPLLPLIFVIGMQFSGYSLYRLFSKKHDVAINMKSTVALVSEKRVKMLSYSAIGLAVISYISLFINFFTLKISALGYLPPIYLAPIVVCLLFIPLMLEGILNPAKADMKKNYRVIYLATVTFIIANLIVFIFFR